MFDFYCSVWVYQKSQSSTWSLSGRRHLGAGRSSSGLPQNLIYLTLYLSVNLIIAPSAGLTVKALLSSHCACVPRTVTNFHRYFRENECRVSCRLYTVLGLYLSFFKRQVRTLQALPETALSPSPQGLYKEDKILGIHFPGSTGGNSWLL